jgi:hypothetical protein
MTDILRDLPRFTWRGIELPILSRSARFTQNNAKHRFSYKDGEFIEATGTENWTFQYTLPMREGVVREPYRKLFITEFTKFVSACRDRTTGDLIDPVLGPFRAKCTSLSDSTDVNKRDGDDLAVEFVQSPEEGDEDELWTNVENLTSASNEAGKLDEQIGLVVWEQEDSPEPTADPLALVDGLIRQAEMEMNQISAAVDNAAWKLEKVENSVERLQDPTAWPINRSARRLRKAVHDIGETAASPGRIIRNMTTAAGITLSALAASVGMSVQELLTLNPTLAGTPMVYPGTPVLYYGD